MENPLGAQKAIRARELVAVVSPDRKPPLYGQVFQSDVEVERQWSALTSWAAENGVILSMAQAESFRRGREGGGEEHFVYFDEHSSYVVKETRPDSWANKASAGQYFQRWVDLGTLWPALEAELIGISDHSIFVRQRFIDGDIFENRAALEADMGANGWERIGPIRFRHIRTGAVITDANPAMTFEAAMEACGRSMWLWNRPGPSDDRERPTSGRSVRTVATALKVHCGKTRLPIEAAELKE